MALKNCWDVGLLKCWIETSVRFIFSNCTPDMYCHLDLFRNNKLLMKMMITTSDSLNAFISPFCSSSITDTGCINEEDVASMRDSPVFRIFNASTPSIGSSSIADTDCISKENDVYDDTISECREFELQIEHDGSK